MTTTTKGLGVMVIGKNNTVLALSGAIPFALSVIFAMYMSGFNWKWLISLVIACAIIATWSFYIIHERKKKGERIKLEVSSVSQVTGGDIRKLLSIRSSASFLGNERQNSLNHNICMFHLFDSTYNFQHCLPKLDFFSSRVPALQNRASKQHRSTIT